jgi:amino acid adenylation domain-containing protein
VGGHSLRAIQVVSRVSEATGVEVGLAEFFEEPTVAAMAALVEAAARESDGLRVPPILPASVDGDLPLSFAQQRLWFLDQLQPGSPFYNIPRAIRLRGTLDVAALERAINQIVRRHEILRTTFPSVDGEPVQAIAHRMRLPLPIVDLSELEKDARDAEARRLADEEAARPFDLETGPLMRTTLVRLADDDHLLLWTVHHIVFDGWSRAIFHQELAALYAAYVAGRPSPLPELPIQYGDFAVWQREWLSGDVLERHLDYWRTVLAGAPALLELPTDKPRPAVQTYRGEREALRLSPEVTARLKVLARREGATLFMTLLAAFDVLLARYTGRDDIVVGSPTAGRTRTEVESLVGVFANTLVLRTDLSGNPSFRELLGRVRTAALGAYTHQDVPFEKLVEELQLERDLSHAPLVQVMFALQNAPSLDLRLPDLTLEALPVRSGTEKVDLFLSLTEGEDDVRGVIGYNTDLFESETVRRIADQFAALVEAIVDDPSAPISELDMLSPAERRRILVDWNDTQALYPSRSCIHDLVAEQAARTPDAIAVEFDGHELSYRELERRANQVANALRRLGVDAETLVGICVYRSLDMVVGLLGIMKSGGAYVPLDPSYPAERLSFMLEDARAPVLVTQSALRNLLPTAAATVLCLDDDLESISRESADPPPALASPDNLAYVIYTSGSTGRPKGVEVPHRGVVNFLTSVARRPGLGPDDRFLGVASISFDASVLDLYLPLVTGARLVVTSREVASDARCLLDRLASSGVNTMHATPSTWRLLIEAGWNGTPRLKIFSGGEALPPDLGATLARLSGPVWNLYGPTETSVYSALAEVSADGDVVVGRPIANTRVYILDAARRPVPIGVPGELYIGGDGVTRGYHDREELTAERFLGDPFVPDGRMYRTGDLARYRAHGTIEYLGRIDHQVKLRGYRIELGEVESVLQEHPAVGAAVAVVREDHPGDKRLVAYVVAVGAPPAVADLRALAKSKLPDYMVPSAFVTLDRLPLSPNGKVDRATLPAPETARPEVAGSYSAPRNGDEEAMAAIWSEVLRVDGIGVNDNFFELGGHSLIATRVVSRARDRFGVELPLLALFEQPTIAGLVEVVARLRKEGVTQQSAQVVAVSREAYRRKRVAGSSD